LVSTDHQTAANLLDGGAEPIGFVSTRRWSRTPSFCPKLILVQLFAQSAALALSGGAEMARASESRPRFPRDFREVS